MNPGIRLICYFKQGNCCKNNNGIASTDCFYVIYSTELSDEDLQTVCEACDTVSTVLSVVTTVYWLEKQKRTKQNKARKTNSNSKTTKWQN